jgi:hypothetical protein
MPPHRSPVQCVRLYADDRADLAATSANENCCLTFHLVSTTLFTLTSLYHRCIIAVSSLYQTVSGMMAACVGRCQHKAISYS